MKTSFGALALVLLTACQRQSEQNSGTMIVSRNTVATTVENQPEAAPRAKPAENVALPAERTPLAEPKAVQHYGALVEQGRFADAAKYWGSADAAADFAKTLKSDGAAHLEIGKPGDMEGAAGSSYVTVPVIFYGDKFRRAADIILRRVNDVPGSTEAQRRWHIER